MKITSYFCYPTLFKSFVIISLFTVIAAFLPSCGLLEKSSGPQTKEKPGTDKPDKKRQQKEERKAQDEQFIDTTVTKKEVKTDSLDKVYPRQYKGTYNIAYILPFYLNLENPDESGRKQKIANISKQFYMGSRLALDTLKSCGINLNVHIFDTKNDSLQVQKIKEQLNGENLDLIFGPLFSENVKIISGFSASNKVNMIAPLAHVKSCVKSNPYFISVLPGEKAIAQNAAKLINKQFPKDHVYVVRQYNKTERQIAWQLDSLIDTSALRSYNKLALSKDNWKRQTILNDTLKDKNNVLFIPSTSEAFTTSIISGIKAISIEDEENDIEDEITIIGLSNWRDFGSLNGKIMEKFSIHLLTNYKVNYNDMHTRQFVFKYREENNNEPSEYAIRGYDLTLMAGKMVAKYGKYFQRTWHSLKTDGIHTDFVFNRIKGKRGWQNFYMETVKFEDYGFKKMFSNH